MKWSLRQKITALTLIVLLTLLAITLLYNHPSLQAVDLAKRQLTDQIGSPVLIPTADAVPTMVPKKEASFDPANYGLPPEIGGYQIRAVKSSETHFCNPSTDLELILYAIPNQPQTLTTADIQGLKDITHRRISISIVSWPITISELESQNEGNNAVSCFSFGGPLPDDVNVNPVNTALPAQSQAIIPPTSDTSQIIAPPTTPFTNGDSSQNMPIIPPTPDVGSIPTPTLDPSFTPAYWGLPAQVGGYEIMVVTSSENEKCSPPNQLQLLLHAIPDQPQTLTTGDVQRLETLTKRTIQLAFTNGVVSIQQVQSQMKDWNAEMAGGCVSLGGPIPSPTTNPDDPISMTSYDPKFWSLPETLAGFKPLVIKNVENSKCVPNAVVQVVLQMSSSEVRKLTKATYDQIMSELDKLHWNLDGWLIGYVTPGTSKEDLVSMCSPNLDRNKLP
ncbi:MAG: hypothetical protein H0X30_00330 [Anaerolineae bacterium]|nr:hypothetical protein [Anaerolineae bacterium]